MGFRQENGHSAGVYRRPEDMELVTSPPRERQSSAPTSSTPLIDKTQRDSEQKTPENGAAPKQTWGQWWTETKANAKEWYNEKANWPNFKRQLWSDVKWMVGKAGDGLVWTWNNKKWTFIASILALHSTFNTIARIANVQPEKLKEAWDNTLSLGEKAYASFAGFASQYINTLMNIEFLPTAWKRFKDIPTYWRNAGPLGRGITGGSFLLALGAAVASFSVSTAAFAWMYLPLALVAGGTAFLSSFGTRSVTATLIGEKAGSFLPSSEAQTQEIDWLNSLKDNYRYELEQRLVAVLEQIKKEMSDEQQKEPLAPEAGEEYLEQKEGEKNDVHEPLHPGNGDSADEEAPREGVPNNFFDQLNKEQKERVFQAAIDYINTLSGKDPNDVFKNYESIKNKYTPKQTSHLFKAAMALYLLCSIGAGVAYFFTFLQKGFDGPNDFEKKVFDHTSPTFMETNGYGLGMTLGVFSGLANYCFATKNALDVVWTLINSMKIIRKHEHPVPMVAGFAFLMYLNYLAGGAMHSVARGIVAHADNISHIPSFDTDTGKAFVYSVEVAADAANVKGSLEQSVNWKPPVPVAEPATLSARMLAYFKAPVAHPLSPETLKNLEIKLSNVGVTTLPKQESKSSWKSWCSSWCPSLGRASQPTTYAARADTQPSPARSPV